MVSDKDHGSTPSPIHVPTGPITRSKAKKIQQAFITHVQEWIGSDQALFPSEQPNSDEDLTYDTLKINVCNLQIHKENIYKDNLVQVSTMP